MKNQEKKSKSKILTIAVLPSLIMSLESKNEKLLGLIQGNYYLVPSWTQKSMAQ